MVGLFIPHITKITFSNLSIFLYNKFNGILHSIKYSSKKTNHFFMEIGISTEVSSYLSFKLDEEVFAANVNQVLEILELPKITRVPQSPAHMRGVINLRGAVLPVINARLKFGLGQCADTSDSCIIVLDINLGDEKIRIGLLVDAVEEVLEIDKEDILPPPSVGSKQNKEFILGIYKNENDLLMILEPDKILSEDEVTTFQSKVKD